MNTNRDRSGVSARPAPEGAESARDAASSPRRDRALDLLRARGERVTPGRRAVIDVLDAQEGHLDAEAVAALVDEREPGIHRATIYRSLQALVEAGVVVHTHVPGGATIYHLAALRASDEAHDTSAGAAAGAGHGHAHLQCVGCGEFTDVDADEFAPLVARIRELTGFAVDAQHGALLGVCRRCGGRGSVGGE